jgi:hypothetical protein
MQYECKLFVVPTLARRKACIEYHVVHQRYIPSRSCTVMPDEKFAQNVTAPNFLMCTDGHCSENKMRVKDGRK